jgi:hypothetical protein
MKLSPMELYVIYQALLARKEWVEEDGEASSPEELDFIKSAIEKIKSLGVELDMDMKP